MSKLYIPTPADLHGAKLLDERLWWPAYQSLLVPLANTNEGRDILSLDPWRRIPFRVVAIGKNYVRYYLGRESGQDWYMTDFRVGGKYRNVVWHRWPDIQKALDRMNLQALLSLPRLIALPNGRCLPVPAGGTDSEFFPDPSVETDTVDGYTGRESENEIYTDIRNGVGEAADDSSVNANTGYLQSTTTPDRFASMYHSHYGFLTSSIGSDNVDSGDLSLWPLTVASGLGSALPIHICKSTHASPTALAASDFQNIEHTSFGSTPTFATGAYEVITLNASGLANIDTGGVSQFSAQNKWDQAGSFTGSWASNASANYDAYTADRTGTANDPRLRVTHTAAIQRSPSGGVGYFGGGVAYF